MRRGDAKRGCEEGMRRGDAKRGCEEGMRRGDAKTGCAEGMRRRDVQTDVGEVRKRKAVSSAARWWKIHQWEQAAGISGLLVGTEELVTSHFALRQGRIRRGTFDRAVVWQGHRERTTIRCFPPQSDVVATAHHVKSKHLQGSANARLRGINGEFHEAAGLESQRAGQAKIKKFLSSPFWHDGVGWNGKTRCRGPKGSSPRQGSLRMTALGNNAIRSEVG